MPLLSFLFIVVIITFKNFEVTCWCFIQQGISISNIMILHSFFKSSCTFANIIFLQLSSGQTVRWIRLWFYSSGIQSLMLSFGLSFAAVQTIFLQYFQKACNEVHYLNARWCCDPFHLSMVTRKCVSLDFDEVHFLG